MESRVCVCVCVWERERERERERELGLWGKEQEERRGDWGSKWKGREVRTTYLPPSPSISLESQFLTPCLRPPSPLPSPSPLTSSPSLAAAPPAPARQQLERYEDTSLWPAHSGQKSPGMCWGVGLPSSKTSRPGRPTSRNSPRIFQADEAGKVWRLHECVCVHVCTGGTASCIADNFLWVTLNMEPLVHLKQDSSG